ncbi:hypothetical protein GGX14DRAFT_644150 [Mycena pura]|uniref:Uncharacterized protein n=1 Tax=Mycena pura TaxID=153505 RepID=A0AAD6VB20_9AGAR|nr:hypothetical protein GGX14DRAFT_644150 [Mycena pura]
MSSLGFGEMAGSVVIALTYILRKRAQGPIVTGENDKAQTETVVENEDRDSDETLMMGFPKRKRQSAPQCYYAGSDVCWAASPTPNDAFQYVPVAGEALFADAGDAWATCVTRDGVPVWDTPGGDPDWVVWTPRGVGRHAGEGTGGIGGEAARVLEQSGLREAEDNGDVDGSYETLLVYADAGDTHMHARARCQEFNAHNMGQLYMAMLGTFGRLGLGVLPGRFFGILYQFWHLGIIILLGLHKSHALFYRKCPNRRKRLRRSRPAWVRGGYAAGGYAAGGDPAGRVAGACGYGCVRGGVCGAAGGDAAGAQVRGARVQMRAPAGRGYGCGCERGGWAGAGPRGTGTRAAGGRVRLRAGRRAATNPPLAGQWCARACLPTHVARTAGHYAAATARAAHRAAAPVTSACSPSPYTAVACTAGRALRCYPPHAVCVNPTAAHVAHVRHIHGARGARQVGAAGRCVRGTVYGMCGGCVWGAALGALRDIVCAAHRMRGVRWDERRRVRTLSFAAVFFEVCQKLRRKRGLHRRAIIEQLQLLHHANATQGVLFLEQPSSGAVVSRVRRVVRARREVQGAGGQTSCAAVRVCGVRSGVRNGGRIRHAQRWVVWAHDVRCLRGAQWCGGLCMHGVRHGGRRRDGRAWTGSVACMRGIGYAQRGGRQVLRVRDGVLHALRMWDGVRGMMCAACRCVHGGMGRIREERGCLRVVRRRDARGRGRHGRTGARRGVHSGTSRGRKNSRAEELGRNAVEDAHGDVVDWKRKVKPGDPTRASDSQSERE